MIHTNVLASWKLKLMEMEREEKGQCEQRQRLQGETECEPFILLANVY